MPQKNLAHFSGGRLAVLQRERDGHGGANPEIAFLQVRKKFAAQPRRDKEERSKREGQFQSDHQEAVSQRKTQRRIVEAMQHADDDGFRFLHVLGKQDGGQHRRDR